METPAYGRRRLTRTPYSHLHGDESLATTASSLQAGPSRLPEMTQLVDVHFSDLGRDSDDPGSEEHDTPRVQALAKLPAAENDLQTPAARLRAILSRVPTGASSSSPDATPVATQPPKAIPFYDSDSDMDMDVSTQVNKPQSAAHTSIRSIFSNALRPAGDTPEKPRQRPRRNSIDTSEVEDSPALERAQHRAKRKSLSLSDDEVENLSRNSRRSQLSFKTRPQHSGLEVLRQRFMNSSGDEGEVHQDGNLSDETAKLLRELNSGRTSPPAATSTPLHSLQMSMTSGFQLQSNLLDHDSEMQRAIDHADTYTDFPSKFVEPADPSELDQSVDFPAEHEDLPDLPRRPSSAPRSHPTANLTNAMSDSQPEASTSKTPASNHVSTPSTIRHARRISSNPLDRPVHQRSPRISLHEASTGSLSRAGSVPLIPGGKSPRGRVVSSNSSSRSSSFSQADYQDRMDDLDQDHMRDRERDWNRPNRTLTRATSSASLRSPGSGDRQRTQSLSTASIPSNREPYQLPPSVQQALRRHSALAEDREDSPTHSLNGSPDPERILPLIVHERERNWMSPRPVWHLARKRTSSISSNGSVDEDEDDQYNPPSSTSRLTSPRSLAEIRNRSAHTPESSPRSANRFGFDPNSPGHKRLSNPSIHSTPATGDLGPSPSSHHRSNRLSLPSPAKSPGLSSDSAEQSTLRAPRRSLIPVSPRKNKSLRSQPSDSMYTDNGTQDMDVSEPPSENEWLPDQQARHGLQPPPQDDQSPYERTPTLKTIEPPPEDDPPSQAEDLTDNEQRPQVPYDSEQEDPVTQELPSFTATPPRHGTSFARSRVEAESPSRSFEVPELPGPPPDESESEGPWDTPAPSRLFAPDPNSTAAKTPKPPGGWLNTPAPRRRNRAYSDSSTTNRSNFLAPPSDGPNWSTMQTPKPPGGWTATPAPKKAVYVDQAVETDTEQEGFDSSAADTEDGEGQPPQMLGLVTPVSSLSRGKYHNAQTPHAPGAWVQTPAPRKSVMKVRFDSQPSSTREFGTDTGDESVASQGPEQPETSLQTPPASPEMEHPSPSKRRAPSVRVLDAYGNETKEEEDHSMNFSSIKTPRRQPIRFVDALGNSVEEPSVDEPEDDLVKKEEGAGESRQDILAKVRRGLDELEGEMRDLDRSSSLKSNLAHIKDLDAVTLASREKRRKLTQQLKEANTNVKEQAKKHTTPQPTVVLTKSRIPLKLLVLLSLAGWLLMAAFIYYLYISWTHEAYLTNYYDPYNPLLHLSPFKSQAASPNLSTVTPWKSLLRRQDLKAFGQQTIDNLVAHVVQFQSFLWERWGEDVAAPAWPPT